MPSYHPIHEALLPTWWMVVGIKCISFHIFRASINKRQPTIAVRPRRKKTEEPVKGRESSWINWFTFPPRCVCVAAAQQDTDIPNSKYPCTQCRHSPSVHPGARIISLSLSDCIALPSNIEFQFPVYTADTYTQTSIRGLQARWPRLMGAASHAFVRRDVHSINYSQHKIPQNRVVVVSSSSSKCAAAQACVRCARTRENEPTSGSTANTLALL